MSENGTGNPEVIEFEELIEEKEPTNAKEQQLATFLKAKLSDEDFGAAAKILGIDTEDLSNAELLEKLTELLQGKKEEVPPEEKDDEKEMADYKTYMKDCMAEGKTMEDCQAEYKKKYPSPKEKMEEAPEDLNTKPENEELTELRGRILELENNLKLEKINAEVSELVTEKHLSPRQVGAVVKLGAAMTPELKEEFFGLFKTQKFTVSEDKGLTASTRPGQPEAIPAETRARLMKEYGITDLINDKGVRRNN